MLERRSQFGHGGRVRNKHSPQVGNAASKGAQSRRFRFG
jgi:hypothetical protein